MPDRRADRAGMLPPGGEALGVAVLMNFASEPKASFTYRRLREYPIAGGPSTLRESIWNPALQERAEHLLASLGWIGVAMVEFKVDPRDGEPKLLEVNPRFWGSLHHAIVCGVDFPFLLYRLAMDGDVDPGDAISGRGQEPLAAPRRLDAFSREPQPVPPDAQVARLLHRR